MQDDDASVSLAGREAAPAAGSSSNEYAVGKNADIFPEGTGRLVKAGAKIRFNMHYHPIGEAKSDASQIALYVLPEGLHAEVLLQSSHTGDNDDMDMPAGIDNIRTEGYSRLNQNARVTAFQPHLHNRGKAQCMEAIYPDGKQGDAELRRSLQVRLAHRLQLRRGGRAAAAEGHDPAGHQLAQQHVDQHLQPRSAELGRVRPALDRRHAFAWVSYVWLTTRSSARPSLSAPSRRNRRTPSSNSSSRPMQGRLTWGAVVVAATIAAAPLGAGQQFESQIPYGTGQNVAPVYEGWETESRRLVQHGVRLHEPEL